ncbi:hypothetical protein OsJ_23081 [Oryza sativa Japonica Group]|uniref:Uncharacterized protein n=1 Tax=Oryza sativa subsp. japonica TaxID=39947 RepID=A3BGJ6_ORYSJ|nr:hypothetical protein OsJ_23081 [Oryza sativa Japonica Group]
MRSDYPVNGIMRAADSPASVHGFFQPEPLMPRLETNGAGVQENQSCSSAWSPLPLVGVSCSDLLQCRALKHETDNGEEASSLPRPTVQAEGGDSREVYGGEYQRAVEKAREIFFSIFVDVSVA